MALATGRKTVVVMAGSAAVAARNPSKERNRKTSLRNFS
jgi:hypothetical protein